jgi:hypothetical protein
MIAPESLYLKESVEITKFAQNRRHPAVQSSACHEFLYLKMLQQTAANCTVRRDVVLLL